MKLTKKVQCAALAVLLGLSGGALSGCGSSSSSDGRIEVAQWYHDYGEDGTKEAVKKYAEEFNNSQDKIHVTVTVVSGDYASKLNAALLAGNGPDVFESEPSGEHILAGHVAPVDDLFGDALSDFNQNNIQAVTYKDKIYGVPMTDGDGLLYYRKSMLQAAGVTPPTTLDELIAASKKLTTGKVKGLFLGNSGCTQDHIPQLAVWSAGNEIIDSDGNVKFNNDRTVKAFNKMTQLCTSGSLLQGASTDWYDATAFTSGQTAMQWAGQWSLPSVQEALGDDFGVVPWPALDDQGQPATWYGGWYSQVNAASKNIKAAKQFVKWLWVDNKDAQKEWSTKFGATAPVRQSIIDDTPALNKEPASVFMEAIKKYGHLSGGVYWSTSSMTALSTALGNVVNKGADAKTEIEKAATTIANNIEKTKAEAKVK
ncbi:MAG: extracellular solute-binding protein [Bifidobacteriaceae bacterium]|jgi:multiple sugar transport system substrate-binding protein|nr:extracellular solute-binding protein [Bifidobacteriaceae bacterium]MCI1979466.1 extracellular solute-binding protein [Bifidobacteriaceae bacterium]